jgi:hypothetical protein
MVDARLDTQLQLALNALMPDVHPPQEENAGDSPS